MATAELTTAAQRAVLERVRTQLRRLPSSTDAAVIGIRSPEPPVWPSDTEFEIDGRAVRVAPCPSLLAVLDALAARTPGAVLVLVTDRSESELGDAVLARLHRGALLEADRHTLLDDLLAARRLDPRIRGERWLVDALVELAGADRLPPTAGATLSRPRVLTLVATARLGVDPEQVDLPGLTGAFDADDVRVAWRGIGVDERDGLIAHLVSIHGEGARAAATLAAYRDDVLADLLVAQAIVDAPVSDTTAAVAYGRFTESRFPEATCPAAPLSRAALHSAARAAVELARADPSGRVEQQIRRADTMLDQLHAGELAVHSSVLARGYVERLARAAHDLTEDTLADVAAHRLNATQGHRHQRLTAALRLRRWLETEPAPALTTAAAGLTRHARELSWVDRALVQVRAGDADPRVGPVLADVAARAGAARAGMDTAFAARLAVAPATPQDQLAVETLLPRVVAPLARHGPVLLVVVDGMSGAVAGDLVDRLVHPGSGWQEIVRASDGGREAVLAAFPTETTYSRTSLFRACLRPGNAADEKPAFAAHEFWPPGGAVLVHKSGVAGTGGSDLGAELEEALAQDGPPVVGVVLNAVDEALRHGRQATDPAWRPADVNGLMPLMERAAESGRTVVLTSDHGHVLEHGSVLRSDPTGGARWRAPGASPGPDEVLLAGPRVLTPDNTAVLAAVEELRYSARAAGYHGGATLAEVAIPLIVLLPPGAAVPGGWQPHTLGAPAWWTGAGPTLSRPTPTASTTPEPRPQPARRSPVRRRPQQSEALFDAPDPASVPTRGARLVASESFRDTHAGLPANRVPDTSTVAAVVDALDTAGGRLPVESVLVAAGSVGRNPRGVVAALTRVLNRDSFAVLTLVDGGRTVVLDRELLDEQFPPAGAG